ncbi:MAG: hypothetical protein M3437_19415, partial [Chloroflexota bacterium]|nr:hypothetical protein [Chloroflexota bacterium]
FGTSPEALGVASGVSFLAGVFPNKGFSVAARAVNKMLRGASSLPETLEKWPISGLSSIDYWTEARLLEENVETVQGMATVEIQQLVLGTHYPTERIVNWIDESILMLHCGAWIVQLNRVGINTASKLLNAVGYEPEDFAGFTGKTPDPDAPGVAWLVEAVAAAGASSTPASIATVSDASTSTSEPSGTGTDAPSSASSDTPDSGDTASAGPALTSTIIYELCKSIYPERNMKYIKNFYRSSYYRYTQPESLVSQAVPMYTTTISRRVLAPGASDAAAHVESSTNGTVSENGSAAAGQAVPARALTIPSSAAPDGQPNITTTDGTDLKAG